MKRLLLLDDDRGLLAELSTYLSENGFVVSTADTPEEAERMLEQGVDFAIVDLFLLGDRGDELSNGFIAEVLIPRNIPYGRLTSAPRWVPANYRGSWVLDKRQVRNDPGLLLRHLLKLLS